MTERLRLRLTIYGITSEADLARCVSEIETAGAEVSSTALDTGGGLTRGILNVLVADPHLFLRTARGMDWFDQTSVHHMGSVADLSVPQALPMQVVKAYREHCANAQPIPRRWYA